MITLTNYNEIVILLDRLPTLAKEKRLLLNLSVRGAAKIIGISFSTLDRYERNKVDINIRNLKLILKWVGEK